MDSIYFSHVIAYIENNRFTIHIFTGSVASKKNYRLRRVRAVFVTIAIENITLTGSIVPYISFIINSNNLQVFLYCMDSKTFDTLTLYMFFF